MSKERKTPAHAKPFRPSSDSPFSLTETPGRRPPKHLFHPFSSLMHSVEIPLRCLGVVIPVYNEEKTLHIIVEKVHRN
jgi:hypothetical protein